jgi:hypothetical protein
MRPGSSSRALGSVSDRLFNADVGVLSAGSIDVGRADPARRLVRISAQNRADALDLECELCGGSLVAAFMQGVMVGALVEGLPLADRHYVGGEVRIPRQSRGLSFWGRSKRPLEVANATSRV